MTRKAFSLAELLIVMSIVALLAAIISPTVSRSAAHARQAICADRLRQLGGGVVAAQNARLASGARKGPENFFLKANYWPHDVVEHVRSDKLFLCPEDAEGDKKPNPPVKYWSALQWKYLPFDGSHYSCVERKGSDKQGRYVEYCIEEAPQVPSKWSHAECCGVAGWSTNDGIWRFYEPVGGVRKLVLTFYDCGVANWLEVEEEVFGHLRSMKIPYTWTFTDQPTSFGYNVAIDNAPHVGQDTIVLLDFLNTHIDITEDDITTKLNHYDSARHLGRHNVLYADGSVKPVGTVSLYPAVNMAQWTPDSSDVTQWTVGND
ncbi:MAG: type II secretion system protein [Planctomycetota bacterium]|jgi:prepilin-type N-terminal cleavage/methylation domain-containing protein/prepilin-type processing-associated H-X9-DG protein